MSPDHLPPDDARMSELLAATADAERAHFWFRGFRRFVTPMLEAAARGRRDLRIADCGAGTGHNLALLSQYGTPVGVELNRTGAIVARARGERRMICGTVTALPLETGAFDLATSFDVLYCLPDAAERAALEEMRRILRPGGRVVINVAAMPMLAGEHSELTHEVRRYTRAGLAGALERGGFMTLRATYTNAATMPIVAAVRTLQKRGWMRGEGGRARDIEVPAAPINTALTAALAIEAALLRVANMPFGSSLLALAEKR
ncbi:MAG: class I SAM-dependent methyltransferase [Acidobacteriota bacterium]|nr:class I SAM-dependent methyltransferase [Acidobacteriota bacterium]